MRAGEAGAEESDKRFTGDKVVVQALTGARRSVFASIVSDAGEGVRCVDVDSSHLTILNAFDSMPKEALLGACDCLKSAIKSRPGGRLSASARI